MATLGWVLAVAGGVGLVAWGAEAFAEHLGRAAVVLGVSSFALALLLAGAEPEELVTGVIASARHVPAIAVGDVIGADVAMCLVALGVGAVVAPLPFGRRVRAYALAALPVGAVSAATMWGGRVSRAEGAVLVVAYVAYVAVIWRLEGAPPAIGEVGELAEAREAAARGALTGGRASRDVGWLLAGVAAMTTGGVLLVEGIRHLASVQDTQTVVSLTIVGLATAFELVVLAWSAARRGAPEAVVAAVIGSFAYNATMTLGAAALVRPLVVSSAGRLHLPLVCMVAALGLVVALAWRAGRLGRRAGALLLGCYPVFVVLAVAVG